MPQMRAPISLWTDDGTVLYSAKLLRDGNHFQKNFVTTIVLLSISLACLFFGWDILTTASDRQVSSVILLIVMVVVTAAFSHGALVTFPPWFALQRMSRKQRVPNFCATPAQINAYQVVELVKKVNSRINAWNFYCRGIDGKIREPMTNEPHVAQVLDEMIEETKRHLHNAQLYLEMEKEGTFTTFEDTESYVSTSLEDVRELEDRLRRNLSSVNFDLNDPLQVEARMAEVDEELLIKPPLERTAQERARAQQAHRKTSF